MASYMNIFQIFASNQTREWGSFQLIPDWDYCCVLYSLAHTKQADLRERSFETPH
jgi:hypothetical protein